MFSAIAEASDTGVTAALTFSTRHGECARNFNTAYHTFREHNSQSLDSTYIAFILHHIDAQRTRKMGQSLAQ